MPIPAILATLGPLFAEAGGAAAGTAAVGQAASATAASTAATEGLTAALTSALAGGGGGGGGGGLTGYDLGGKVPKVPLPGFGLLGKAMGALIKPVTTLPKQLEDWGQSLLDSRRNLMAFNGAIAGTIMEAERRDIVRKMEEGRRVSDSTKLMSEELSDLKDEFQPLKDVIVNGFNLIARSSFRNAAFAVKALKNHPIVAAVLGIQELLTNRGDGEGTAFMRFIEDIRKEGFDFNDPNDNLMGGGFEREIQQGK